MVTTDERESRFDPPDFLASAGLAEMISTTGSWVSFFMNRFRKLGIVSYNGRIQVHRALLNVVLLDQLPEHNAQKPRIALTTWDQCSSSTLNYEQNRTASFLQLRHAIPLR
jgi:hypothetical protein